MRNLYLSLLELLKEFWKCFPPTTPQLEAEATRMHDILQRFAMVKLKPFEVRDTIGHTPIYEQKH